MSVIALFTMIRSMLSEDIFKKSPVDREISTELLSKFSEMSLPARHECVTWMKTEYPGARPKSCARIEKLSAAIYSVAGCARSPFLEHLADADDFANEIAHPWELHRARIARHFRHMAREPLGGKSYIMRTIGRL